MSKTFTDVKWRKGTEKKRKKKDFYKVIKLKTELFKCCCSYLSVLVRKWDVPREKRKVPLGFLCCQKPHPRIQHPLPAPHPAPNSRNIISRLVDAKAERHSFNG